MLTCAFCNVKRDGRYANVGYTRAENKVAAAEVQTPVIDALVAAGACATTSLAQELDKIHVFFFLLLRLSILYFFSESEFSASSDQSTSCWTLVH